MGLFGPSWSWEEIQKKDALMGELKKENDRVLDKQRKENDRVIRSVNNINNSSYGNEKTIQKQKQIDALNAYNNSLDKKDHEAIDRIVPEARRIDRDIIRSHIIVGKPFNGVNYGYHRDSQIRFFLLLGIWPMSVICGAVFFFHPNLFCLLVVLFGIFYIKAYYRILLNIIPAYLISNKLKETDCYKGLLEKLQNIDLETAEYIGVGPSYIRIIYNHKSTINIFYSEFKFPDLPSAKWGILLANLLKDLNLTKKYSLCTVSGLKEKWMYLFVFMNGDYTNCRGVHSRFYEDNLVFSSTELAKSDLVVYNYTVYAKNEELFKSIEKKNNYNKKKLEKDRKENLKKGKTW